MIRSNPGMKLQAIALACLFASACGPREAPPIAVLGAEANPPAAARPAQPAGLVLGRERRDVWPGGASWRLATGGEAGRLLLGAGGEKGLTLEVDLVDGEERRPLVRQPLAPGRWQDRAVAVPAAGRGAALEGRLAGCAGPTCGWSATAFVPDARARRPSAGPPNVLIVLTDTLRADALGAYGAPPGSTPALDALARSGTRFDQARAQCSWTLPSVASLFTSLWSGEVRDWAKMPQHLPAPHLTAAEVFARAGYLTAGFSAHAMVSHDTGYGQGFGSFWAPSDEEILEHDALAVADRAADWLGVHQRRPFFAYVHFLDPHAPYCPAARLPKDPQAPIPGDSIAAMHGERPLPDAAEVAEWRRLYAEEVAVVDRGVARLLAALDDEVRRRTVVVFVADHGEEFLDHGFLGHGWSLYDELLRVPLLMSGPGIPAGRVVSEPVGLVDLLPTLTALAGVTMAEGERRPWRGIDLGPAFAGGRLPGRRAFFAQTGSFGPLRISVQRGPLKAVLFNEGADQAADFDSPANRKVRELVPREAVFDLGADPRERDNLAGRAEGAEFLRGVRELVLDHLGSSVAGHWTAVRGRGAGGEIGGTVRYTRPIGKLVPMFLLDGERLTADGDRVSLHLRDDGLPRAWLVADDASIEVGEARIEADGGALAGRPWTGVRSLAPGSWAEWRRREAVLPREGTEENLRRLKALGYIR